MSPEEIISVRNYLCKRFGNEGITIKPRKVADSVEVYLNDEIPVSYTHLTLPTILLV